MTASLESNYNKFRPLAIILEGIPFLILVAAYLLDHYKLKIIGATLMVFVYILAGWYLFKGKKYNFWQVLLATLTGIFLSVVIIGFAFEILDWEFGKEMTLVSTLTLYWFLILSFIYMVFRLNSAESRPYQLTMSVKIFSRFLFLMIFLYASGLNVHMDQLMAQ